MPELSDIKDKIISLADAYIKSGKPYLLSQLGKDLGEDLNTLKKLSGIPLSKYIEKYLSEYFSLVLLGDFKNIQAIVSRDGVARGDTAEADVINTAVIVQEIRVKPRFDYKFWAAFSVPPKSSLRCLDLETFRFQDCEVMPEGSNYVEIETSLIPDADIANRDLAINNAIDIWLAKHGFNRERFLSKGHSVPASKTKAGGKSLMEAVIDSLDRRQLAATSLSLDVVAELIRRQY